VPPVAVIVEAIALVEFDGFDELMAMLTSSDALESAERTHSMEPGVATHWRIENFFVRPPIAIIVGAITGFGLGLRSCSP
jgi:hypothetical protein